MPALPSFSTFDVRSAWKKVELKHKTMTKEERMATLVDAGILTPKGNFRKPYQRLARLFRPAKPAAAAEQK